MALLVVIHNTSIYCNFKFPQICHCTVSELILAEWAKGVDEEKISFQIPACPCKDLNPHLLIYRLTTRLSSTLLLETFQWKVNSIWIHLILQSA